MKCNKSLFTFVFCFFSFFSQAQTALPEFAPHGARWVYETIDYSRNPTYGDHYLNSMVVLDHDTVVEGKTCRIFSYAPSIAFFAYRDTLKLWVHSTDPSQHWQLLYDFGWLPGQNVTVPTYYWGSGGFSSTPAIVDAVKDTVINGDTLPVLLMQYPCKTVIMNIGSINNSFVPQSIFVPEEGPPFVRCYQDTVLGTVKAPGVVNCDTNFHVAVLEIHPSQDVSIYPNPATNVLHINYSSPNTASTLNILSMDGRKIKQVAAPGPTISLDGLPTGCYQLIIYLKEGAIINRKLLIQ